jgi:predicted O-methyltransferase YrrM
MEVDLKLTRRDWAILSGTALTLLGLGFAGITAIRPLAVGIALAVGISVMLFVLLQSRREMLEGMRRNQRDARQHFEQTEALLGLYFSLSETLPPLPKTREWAASPDFLRLVYKQIRKQKPGLVVELGSGSSTIIGGYALQQNGAGRIVSFDHLEGYADESRRAVSFHDLDDRCRVITSSLTNYSLDDGSWKWYNLKNFNPEESIALVIVDGPPSGLQKLSRYPALPLLADWLAEEVTFIVDDGDREDEKIMVEKWLEENPEIESEYHETEEGAYTLQRKYRPR